MMMMRMVVVVVIIIIIMFTTLDTGLRIALVDSKLTTFSHGNFIRYLEASSCYRAVGSERQDDKRSVEGQCLRNIRATILSGLSARISLYLHKSQWG